MARLPSMNYLIQQTGNSVFLIEDGTDKELLSFNITNPNETALAQKKIEDLSELSDEDKCFAHFWSGYFHGLAINPFGLPI